MKKTFPEPQPYSATPYVEIPMALVESSQVACIGYSAERRTLAVQFHRGTMAIYHYLDVPVETFNAFMAAESKGRFHREHIKALPFEKFPAPAGSDLQIQPA